MVKLVGVVLLILATVIADIGVRHSYKELTFDRFKEDMYTLPGVSDGEFGNRNLSGTEVRFMIETLVAWWVLVIVIIIGV